MSTPIQGKAISLFGKPLTPVPPNPVANDGIKFNFTTLQWELAPFGGAGEANTSSNVGTGAVLALPKVGVDLPFKSLSGNPEIVLTPTATEILFAIGAIAQSKITGLVADLLTKIETSSNVGAGAGLALPKVGVDLPFKSLTAGAGIIITPSPTEIEIASIAAGLDTFLLGYHHKGNIGGGARFMPFFGNANADPTESKSQEFLAFAFTVNRMTIVVGDNTRSDSTEVTFRKNGVDQAATTIIIPAATTGSFDTGAISVSVAASDLFTNKQVRGAGTGDLSDIGVLVEVRR